MRPHRDAEAGPRRRPRPHVGAAGGHGEHDAALQARQPLPPALAANARVTGRIVQITAHDAREVESMLAVLHAAGCEPEDLEIGRADLEDVFIEIMRGETPQRVAA